MDKENLLKEVIYKSNHRGCRELDILLGKFIENNSNKISFENLQKYRELLKKNDDEIYRLIIDEKILDNFLS